MSIVKHTRSSIDFSESDGESDTGGLLNAMQQLAWERDIDLTKGKGFVPPMQITEEEEKPSSAKEESAPALDKDCSDATSKEKDIPEQYNMKDLSSTNTKHRSKRVAPSPDNSAPNSAGSQGKEQGDTQSLAKTKTKTKTDWSGRTPKPSSNRQFQSASGSKSSKNSKKPTKEKDKKKKKIFTISGSRSSLNSASSLTSLLNVNDNRKEVNDDNSEF